MMSQPALSAFFAIYTSLPSLIIPSIWRESVITRPSNPISSLSTSETSPFEIVTAFPSPISGKAICAVIIAATPASIDL